MSKTNDYFKLEEEVKRELKTEIENNRMIDCVEKVLSFYNDNKPQFEKAISNYYSVCNNPREYVMLQKTINKGEFQKILGRNNKNILILTANDIESKILTWTLKNKTHKIINNFLLDDGVKYDCVNINFCKIDKCNILHFDVKGIGDEYTRRAINDVTHFFKPDFIILLGVCYGINYKTQKIGMVNISEHIKGIRINFHDSHNTDEIIFQPIIEFDKSPNPVLTKRITSKLCNIEIIDKEWGVTIEHMFGSIISANSIMSCKTVKDAIISELRKDAKSDIFIGGEMEACGIFKSNYKYAHDHEFDKWIVIKSICDWGESKNSLDNDKNINEYIKSSLQAYAMMNSCALLFFLIHKETFK